MSFDHVPSKSEVMSWNPPRLADYLRKANLTGCDKVILKYSMNGPRFLNMSDNDLQKFPKLHVPFVTKICCEINKKEEKRTIFKKNRPAPQKYHEQEFEQEIQGWDSEEFSDDDYESPDGDDDVDGGDYESPDDGNLGKGGAESDNDYEPPPSDRPEDAPLQICPSKPIGDSDYIDNNRNRHTSAKLSQNQPPAPPERPGASLPPPSTARVAPHLPKCEPSSQRPIKPPAKSPGLPAPHVDRRTKPGSSDRSLPSLPGFPEREEHFPGRKPPMPDAFTTPRRSVVADKPPDLPRLAKPPLPGPGVNRSASSVGRQPAILPPPLQDDAHIPKIPGGAPFNSNTFPLPTRGPSPRPGPSNSESLPTPIHPGGSLPSRLQMAMNTQRPGQKADRLPMSQPQLTDLGPDDEQDLDPEWYVAHVTRAQAEGFLRRINRDGTFLVRDSSKRSSTQPYTLMVLYQDKVYNIQIRYNSEKDVFLLGTGLKNRENFPRVRDIIQFHMKIPLLLIDAKDAGSGPQKQCLLTHSVQY